MNILHATTDPSLLARLKQMLSSSARADIAVGYFFVSGFEAVADEISRQQKVRILVGRTDRQVLEEVARGIQQAEALQEQMSRESSVRRSDQEQAALTAVRHVATGVALLPQTATSEKSVNRLRDLIAAKKVEVHTYIRGVLHAKAYLCWYENHSEPGAAIVGSSNFTLAGLGGDTDRANTELNVRVTGDDEMAELQRWFEALWADSKDVTDDLLTELDRSWAIAQTPPYHVYLKALYELYGEELVAPSEAPIPPRDIQLANFQMDAVAQALKRLEPERFGGVYIADVVGLGKSYVGSEILRQLREAYPREDPPLIVCPAGLVPQWERYSEMFRLGARVISQSMIASPPGQQFDEASGEYVEEAPSGRGIDLLSEFPNHGPVLVDEAHNFRNDATARYLGLKRYLEAGEHKVVLMSATPQNLGPMDVYRQLRLFMDDLDHDLPIEPKSLRDFFSAAQDWYEYEKSERIFDDWVKRGRKGTPPERLNRPTAPRANVEDVLKPVMIRRRRRDIKDLYGSSAVVNGVPVTFPSPVLDNLSYRLDRVYAKAGTFPELDARLRAHAGARYRAVDYLTPEARVRPEYRDLLRARNRVARLIGALLFKRLESSVAAFKSTIDTLIASNRNFRAALEAGFVPIGKTATRLLTEDSFDPDDLLAALADEERRRKAAGAKRTKMVHDVADFDIAAWKKALDFDYSTLSDIASRVAPITPADDDKLRELKRFLARPEVKRDKVLIFSEAETTVDYLFEHLNPGGKDETIARLSGSTRDSLRDIVRRFSPGSQLRPGERLTSPEIRVLIATDVVSEGQNLQDCARVLNYDLHWNPVRLIQRFGRVDRIGQKQTTINLQNMWPDLDVDKGLALTRRLLNRIQAFHDIIGLDNRLLSDTERLNERAMYRIYEKRKMPEEEDGALDELAAQQRGIALLQRIQKEDPTLWETVTNLPDGIRSALAYRPERADAEADDDSAFGQAVLEMQGAQMPLGQPQASSFEGQSPQSGESVVLLAGGQVRRSYAVGGDLSPRPVTASQFVSSVQCQPTTPAAPLPPNTNERVMAAFKAFKDSDALRLGKARRPGSDTRVMRYVRHQLNIVREQFAAEPEELKRIAVLRQIFLDHLPDGALAALGEVRSLHLTGADFIRRLEAVRTRYRLAPREGVGDEAAPEPAIIRIVCSDGLVSP